MAYLPISRNLIQYVDGSGVPYSGAVLKAYKAGTATNLPMATSTAGTTTATSIELNSSGYPEINSNIVLPYINEDFKLALYPTQSAADSNTGAVWVTDNVPFTDLGTDFAATETGTGDAYEIAVILVPPTYTAGQELSFVASEANTGACSLNVNALGAKSIKLADGTDPYNNAIVANMIVYVKYDGTNYQLMNPRVSYIKPSFSVHKNGVSQTSVGTSLEIITWSTEEFDTNNNFASNRFTPTVAGKYLLSASLYFSVNLLGDSLDVAIYKNGALYKRRLFTTSNANSKLMTVTAIADANGTSDYFEIFGANITSADTVQGAATNTYWSGCKVD